MRDSLSDIVLQITGYASDAVQIATRPPIEIQSNRLYDIWTPDGHWIAKQFTRTNEYATSPRREFDGLQLASSIDIAPRPIHFTPHTDSVPPFVIYKYLDGEMWDRRKPTAAELSALSELWQRQHQLTRPDLWHAKGSEHPLRDAIPGLTQQIEIYGQWAQASYGAGIGGVERLKKLFTHIEKAIAELESLAPQMLFCRSDPRFANVIARPEGSLGLIDWEDCGLRDPAREVADLLLHPNQEDLLTLEEWEAFLAPYRDSRRDDRTFERRLSLYMAVFPIYWLAGLLNMGVRRIETGQPGQMSVNGMSLDLRARRYLARTIAWPSGDFNPALEEISRISFFPLEN